MLRSLWHVPAPSCQTMSGWGPCTLGGVWPTRHGTLRMDIVAARRICWRSILVAIQIVTSSRSRNQALACTPHPPHHRGGNGELCGGYSNCEDCSSVQTNLLFVCPLCNWTRFVSDCMFCRIHSRVEACFCLHVCHLARKLHNYILRVAMFGSSLYPLSSSLCFIVLEILG